MADFGATPINYSVDVQSPLMQGLQGFQAGSAIKSEMDKRDQQADALKQQKSQNEFLQSFVKNPNKTADDYANATLMMPGMREQFKQAWDMKDEARQNSSLSDLSQVRYAIRSGNPEVAATYLESKADAMGDTHEAGAMKAQAKWIRSHPESAGGVVDAMLLSHQKGKQLIENMNAMLTGQTAEKTAPFQIDKAAYDAKSAQFDSMAKGVTAKYADPKARQDMDIAETNKQLSILDSQFKSEQNPLKRQELAIQKEGLVLKQQQIKMDGMKLSTVAEKAVNDYSIYANKSSDAAAEAEKVADDYLKSGNYQFGGVLTKGWQSFSTYLGGASKINEIRSSYNAMRVKGVLADARHLGTGSGFTDTDREFLLKPFPDENSSSEYISGWLKSYAKAKRLESNLASASADWVQANKSPASLREDSHISNIDVPKGTSLSSFRSMMTKYATKSPEFISIRLNKPSLTDKQIDEFLSTKGIR